MTVPWARRGIATHPSPRSCDAFSSIDDVEVRLTGDRPVGTARAKYARAGASRHPPLEGIKKKQMQPSSPQKHSWSQHSGGMVLFPRQQNGLVDGQPPQPSSEISAGWQIPFASHSPRFSPVARQFTSTGSSQRNLQRVPTRAGTPSQRPSWHTPRGRHSSAGAQVTLPEKSITHVAPPRLSLPHARCSLYGTAVQPPSMGSHSL
jgi:hypothetical protein